MEAVSQIDPPHIQKLPKQRPAVFPQVPKCAISLLRHRVSVDTDPLDNLVSLFCPLAARAQHGDLISGLIKGTGLVQYARIVRDGLVLDDNEDFFLHLESLEIYNSW